MGKVVVTAEYIDWVHPSVRDVVIEHLSGSSEDRHRFLRRTNEAGIALALSIGGGSGGERIRPLLRSPEDWEILGARLLETVAAGDESSHSGLMRRVIDALEVEDLSPADLKQLQSVAGTLAAAVSSEWDRRNVVVSPRAWQVFFRLQVSSKNWSAPANPQTSWLYYYEAVDLDNDVEFESLATLLELCAVLEVYEPRFLTTVDYPASVEKLITNLDGTVAERIARLPELYEEEDIEATFEDGRTLTMPIEPDSDEDTDREWLGEVQDFVHALASLSVEIGPLTRGLGDDVDEALRVREERKSRFDRFDPDEDYSDYASEPRAGTGEFDIAGLFADL
jgi:hypothetical protein